MNYSKFFQLAKEKGIEQSQIQVSRSSALNFRLFHHEVEGYSCNKSQKVIACGIYNGKFGSASTERLDATTFPFLINQIIAQASLSEKEGEADLFPGSPKYRKANVFNPALSESSAADKIALLRSIEKDILAFDPRVAEIETLQYREQESSSEFYNSFGLKLKQKANHYIVIGGVLAKEGEEAKTGYDFSFGNDFTKFDQKKFVENIVTRATKKFGGVQCVSGKYPTVLDADIVSDLVAYYLQSAIADQVQRHSSLLEGKLGQKIASSKLTIEEKPLTKNVFFSSFDDEGVAKSNKAIVKNGVLKTFLYNRETAKKDGVESTGNAEWEGSKIGTSFSNVFLKGGKQTFDEMIAPIHEGVYITEIAGLMTGINPVSGDFSCQAEGYMIRDGKLAEPLNLITISGNLLKLFKDLKAFDSNVRPSGQGIFCGDAYIKSLPIGGK